MEAKDFDLTTYVMVGLPGSGKSTWAKREHPELPVVSRDVIRAEIGLCNDGNKFVGTKEQEQQVTELEYQRMREYCEKKQDFIIDNTNIGKYRNQLVGFLRDHNARIVMVKMTTPLETCINRRRGQISKEVMRSMASRLIEPQQGEFDDLLAYCGEN